jgi:hypothetical protein
MSIAFSSQRLLLNQEMGADIVSSPINLHNKIAYSIHAVYTGSPEGSLYIAVSIDGENWSVLSDSPVAISAADNTFYNVRVAGYLFARLHYTATSGSGTLNAFFSTKEVT